MNTFYTFIRHCIYVLLCISLSQKTLLAQTWGQTARLTAPAGSNISNFGEAVAISGNYAVVGAVGDDGTGGGLPALVGAGAVHILYNNNGKWTHVKTIRSPFRQRGAGFGGSVSIDGDRIAVGATGEKIDGQEETDIYVGAAYVFDRNQGGPDAWGMVRRIFAPVRTYNSNYGGSVFVKGSLVLVGAFQDMSNAGAAYMYGEDAGGPDNWGLVKQLAGTNVDPGDKFGYAVTVHGDYAAVSAYDDYEDANGANPIPNAGSVYIFKKNQGGPDNWGQIRKVTTITRRYAVFGLSLSMNDSWLAVGAPGDSWDNVDANFVTSSGAVYLYGKNQGGTDNFGVLRKITPAGRHFLGNFGYSVSLSGETIGIGAITESYDEKDLNPLNFAGAAYIFSRNQGGTNRWGQVAKVDGAQRAEDEYLGRSVGLSGDNFIVGARNQYGLVLPGFANTYNLSQPLPVKLANFTAVKQENQIALSWKTTEESNSSHFEIQRSKDGTNWITIGTLKASSESVTDQLYAWPDTKPLFGQNHYRLKMIDADSSFAFSKIVNVNFRNADSYMVYPNPVADIIHLSAEVQSRATRMSLLTLQGTEILKLDDPKSGSLSVQHLPAGSYLISIRYDDGSEETQRVFLKGK